MFPQYPREKGARTCAIGKSEFYQDGIKSYLVRYPGARIHYTIQDHVPGALHILSIVSDVEWDQAYLGEH